MLPGLSQASTFCPRAGAGSFPRCAEAQGSPLLCLLNSGVFAAFKRCRRLGELPPIPPEHWVRLCGR